MLQPLLHIVLESKQHTAYKTFAYDYYNKTTLLYSLFKIKDPWKLNPVQWNIPVNGKQGSDCLPPGDHMSDIQNDAHKGCPVQLNGNTLSDEWKNTALLLLTFAII